MEEFTFPCIPQIQRPTHKLPFPTTTTTTTSSSSLWLLASSPPPQTASPSFRRSFSSTEGATAAALRRSILPPSPALSDCSGGGHRRPPLDDEERMDMLWEDFNEELRAPRWSLGFERRTPKLDRRPTLRMLPTLDALKSACGGARLRHKKPSLGVMLRALKKLFVVQGAHNTTTTTTSSKKKFMK